MGKASLPPGFRFSPTDVELVKYYLKRKLMRKRLHVNLIAEVDIYKYAPWDLPDKACWRSGDLKWYFFCPREKKYANGARMNRGTECGYWKTTGKDRNVLYSGEVVGWIKTLIFHTGRAPRGERTDWVMHEYRLDDKHMADRGVPQDSYVLCKIFQKDGPGPRIGAQYGAPFKEEDWTDDEVEICSEALPNANMPEPALAHPNNFNSSIAAGTHSPEGIPMGPSESCVSDLLSPSSMVLQPVSSDYVTLEKRHVSTGDDIMASSMVLQPVSSDYVTLEKHHVSTGDDITAMLNCFTEENGLFMIENYKNEELGNLIHPGNANVIPHFNTSDIYKDLGDLGNLARFSEDGYNFSSGHDSTMYTVDQTLAGDNGSFLELVDLDKPINCQSDMYTEHPPMFSQPHTLPGETPFGFVNHENMFKMNFGNY